MNEKDESITLKQLKEAEDLEKTRKKKAMEKLLKKVKPSNFKLANKTTFH